MFIVNLNHFYSHLGLNKKTAKISDFFMGCLEGIEPSLAVPQTAVLTVTP